MVSGLHSGTKASVVIAQLLFGKATLMKPVVSSTRTSLLCFGTWKNTLWIAETAHSPIDLAGWRKRKATGRPGVMNNSHGAGGAPLKPRV